VEGGSSPVAVVGRIRRTTVEEAGADSSCCRGLAEGADNTNYCTFDPYRSNQMRCAEATEAAAMCSDADETADESL
jgi:hypothetical protein